MKIILGFLFTFFSVIPLSQGQSGGVLIPPKNCSIDKRPVPYAYLREADVLWSKRIWRVIDLREKINHPLYYPISPLECRISMFDLFKKSILFDETLTAFNNPALDDQFTLEMTKGELEALLVQWDSTNQSEDPNNPGTYLNVPIKNEITTDRIWKYWMKEDWFFDKQRSVLDVRIIGLCPLVEKKTETGESTGADKALFWIYFPQARPIFATHEVYNLHNDVERRSFDDIFWKRMFSSYIRKETNVHDRSIIEYTSGLDALLESDRIKQEIFNFEHDLWHF